MVNETPGSLTDDLKRHAREIGFAQIGVAPAVTPVGFHRLLDWLRSGYAADMHWMERRVEAYRHPHGVMPGTRSVIMAALNYHDGTTHPEGPKVSRYAWSGSDYHDVLKHRLNLLVAVLKARQPAARTRVVVDTAPLLERDFGRLAGMGWIGRNTMLISRTFGSWFFLGAILTDQELDYDPPGDQDYCGTCTACLDACPTQAFPKPGVLDARRCISYLTIELRTRAIPEDLRTGIGSWLFGCDVCQDVCPWNRFAPDSTIPEFQHRDRPGTPDLKQILRLSEPEFTAMFQGTPLLRSGRIGLLQNAAIVAANLQRMDVIPELQRLLTDNNAVLRDISAWALARLWHGGNGGRND